jgi:hypothetical protein
MQAVRNSCVTSGTLCAGLVAILLVLGDAGAARAQAGAPLPRVDQVWVDKAIKDGTAFLQKAEGPAGTWAPTADDGHAVAYAALPGLTLLECGASPKDPGIKAAAAFVRNAASSADSTSKLDSTYDLALAILFLDKLADSRDRALIQTLILRLVAGQTSTGGWSYKCPVLTRAQLQSLLSMLKATPEQLAKMPGSPVKALPVLWEPGKILQDPAEKPEQPVNGTTDNSNTQFALLAMWTARRYDVPMERTLKLLVTRFRASQNKDGTWDYRFTQGGGGGGAPAMTCCGLLGMAVAHGLEHDAIEKAKLRRVSEAAQVLAGLAGPSPAPGVAPAAVLALPVQGGPPPAAAPLGGQPQGPLANDPMVIKGLAYLSQVIGKPTGRFQNIKQDNLYFLWSLERVGVLYDLSLIGDKDWYRWGAEILVANQQTLGNWDKGLYPGANPTIDTCLALLFLKRVNLIADLTGKLPAQPEDINKSVLKATDPPADTKSDADKKDAGTPVVTAPPPAPTETPVKPTPEPDPAKNARRTEDAAPTPSGLGIWPWLLLGAALLLLTGGGVLVVVSRVARAPAAEAPRRKRPKRPSANGARKAPRRKEEV